MCKRWLLVLLGLVILLQGCGWRPRTIGVEWQLLPDGRRSGEIRILMTPGSTADDVRLVAARTLARARREGDVAFLAIDFTDTTIYYGSRFNLARVEFSPLRSDADTAPLEPGGLAQHWVFREKAFRPEKPRPSNDEIRFFGLLFRSMIGLDLPDSDARWLSRYSRGKSQLEIEQTYLRVQAWLYD